ncbi:MAG TPA: S8 family serine peptidase [Puia sp.]|uniref:S8 family serine peptidase n=1 Tax=Puia sp. TaxID=2045100 RepID=UPI002BC12CFC|nr:S8 family serine peptidase [Puia sp.]HVU97615.1 S8 family serine peptidase [Puia sp.]
MNKSRIPSYYLSALLLLFVLSGTAVQAQVTTNQAALQKSSQQLASQHLALQKILTQTALEKGWPLTMRNKKGRLAYLRGIDSRGLPYYVTTTENIISAATIQTNTLWAGGSTGLNLSGSSANMKGKIAVWDEGLVRPTHVELVGRVTQADGSTTLSDHSTHVSGTMIAAGVNPFARGMSYGAQLLNCYDFDNDESEMATAAGKGLLVSSHSYADIAGWYFDDSQNRWEFWGAPGDTVDNKFGLYDQDAQIWDSIAYNAPFYLIAKAGGNNRGETGPDVGKPYWRMNSSGTFVNSGNRPAGISDNSGYNTIATYGNSKNILTLGAVSPIPGGYTKPSDVVLADFSSLGPAGDGRIKPDVVADGVNVLSSISTADNAYDIYSGTSMSTPASAGSSFLLQEYYQKLHGGTFMRSATLKGLLIHTADEAGPAPGPDYAFGWGLINMNRAASVITSDNTDHSQQVIEATLNGTTASASYSITASGKSPVVATLCWTDPPGIPVNVTASMHNYIDTGRKLINDLDLRIVDNTTGKVFFPWTLDRTKPGAAAKKMDNIRDNVEKVELGDTLVPGRSYTINVTHKGTLQRGQQAYSLLISGGGGTAACAANSAGTGPTIDEVTVNGVSISTAAAACGRKYTDHTADTAFPLPVGSSVAASFANSSCDGSTPTRSIVAWIDFNGDGTFSAGEQVASGTSTGSAIAATIAVPTAVTVGNYALMRVVVAATNDPSTITACGPNVAGETQDYRVAFAHPANDVGVRSLEYPTLTSCANDSQLVSIRIHNYGTAFQSKGIPVTTVVSKGGTPIVTLSATCMDSIPAGAEVVFTYNTPIATTAGSSYTFISKTGLGADPNPANDADTASITTGTAAGAVPNAAATLCGDNATSVVLHATTTGDDVAVWYENPTSSTPIGAGTNSSSTVITSNKTYYVALNDLKAKAGVANKLALPSTSANQGGAYFRFGGNFVMFTTQVPLTIESAKMYIGHSGQMSFTLAQLASFNNTTGEYSYFPMYNTTIDVYATAAKPDTAAQVNVPAGDNTDTGATYLLNIPVPTPGNYIIIFDCLNYATAFLNANISKDPYPITLPGIFSVTGNDFRDIGKADSVSFSHKFYYPFYNIGIRLPGCPGPRTAVTAGTQPSTTITQSGNKLVSSATDNNQWYLNDSLLVDSTAQQIQPKYPGVYYVITNDETTGCVLKSNSIVYTPTTGDANSRIGLRMENYNTGQFQLAFYMPDAANTTIQIVDMVGQRVYEKQLPGFQGQFSGEISAGYLASGMYTLQIVHGNTVYKQKLVVHH